MTRVKHYRCPNCDKTLATSNPKQPFHRCKGLAGLLAPFIPDGTRAKVVAVERGDWVGKELVQVDGNNRPVMAIQTTRDDGQDCTVLAPCASVSTER